MNRHIDLMRGNTQRDWSSLKVEDVFSESLRAIHVCKAAGCDNLRDVMDFIDRPFFSYYHPRTHELIHDYSVVKGKRRGIERFQYRRNCGRRTTRYMAESMLLVGVPHHLLFPE